MASVSFEATTLWRPFSLGGLGTSVDSESGHKKTISVMNVIYKTIIPLTPPPPSFPLRISHQEVGRHKFCSKMPLKL
jgi:hypothetical protein